MKIIIGRAIMALPLLFLDVLNFDSSYHRSTVSPLLLYAVSLSRVFSNSVKSSKDQEENKKQKLTNSECGMFRFRIWDCFNLGFGIADFGLY